VGVRVFWAARAFSEKVTNVPTSAAVTRDRSSVDAAGGPPWYSASSSAAGCSAAAAAAAALFAPRGFASSPPPLSRGGRAKPRTPAGSAPQRGGSTHAGTLQSLRMRRTSAHTPHTPHRV
jgi:hypothetical protein